MFLVFVRALACPTFSGIRSPEPRWRGGLRIDRRQRTALQMKPKYFAVVVALGIITSGCQTCQTGYHPLNSNGGYEECRLQPGLYRVDFHGNQCTKKSTAKDLVLLRAAELTLQEGSSYFETVEKESEYKSVPSSTDSAFLHSPSSSLVIHCLNQRPAGDRVVYDAAKVVGNIRSQYRISAKPTKGLCTVSSVNHR